MPNYTFEDTENKDVFVKFMKIAELEQYLKDNPQLKQVITPSSFGDSVRMGFRKHDNGFREVLSKVKESHYKNTIDIR